MPPVLGNFHESVLCGKLLRFGIADDKPDEVATGIEQEGKCCRCLRSFFVIGPMDGNFSVVRAHLLPVTVEYRGDQPQLIGVLVVDLAMGHIAEVD
jgi:hypothetical protein